MHSSAREVVASGRQSHCNKSGRALHGKRPKSSSPAGARKRARHTPKRGRPPHRISVGPLLRDKKQQALPGGTEPERTELHRRNWTQRNEKWATGPLKRARGHLSACDGGLICAPDGGSRGIPCLTLLQSRPCLGDRGSLPPLPQRDPRAGHVYTYGASCKTHAAGRKKKSDESRAPAKSSSFWALAIQKKPCHERPEGSAQVDLLLQGAGVNVSLVPVLLAFHTTPQPCASIVPDQYRDIHGNRNQKSG